ncbi:MAG: ABC transporter ATP-binding protein, partial [Chloroflexi bacterium]|nr:ABC transporter ATP-binding protein [Chloroflexota bacterium]
MVAASALRGLTNYGNRYFSQVVSQKASYDIRNTLYDHLQRLSFDYYDTAQTGQVMSRVTVDVEAVRMFYSDGLLSLIQTILMILGVSVFLIVLDWKLALITLAFIPFIAWRTISVSLTLQPIYLKVQQLVATLGVTLQESLSGVKVVKAFSRQKDASQKFSTNAKDLYNAQMSAARQTAINMPLMLFLLSLPTALILWYGGRQVIAGSLTIGGLTQFILYLGLLSMPIRRLGFITNTYSRAISAGKRIMEIIDLESSVKEKPDAVELSNARGQVSFENVNFGYTNTSSVLNNINFNVQPGQLVALVGGSGSGKSTIANLVSRFYDVSSGCIKIDGIDIRDLTLSSLRKNVVTAQQDIFLFSATIRDNIAYGLPDAYMEQIVTAAKTAYIHDFILSLPNGYDTWVGERGITLSGGEKQRIV